MLGKRWDNGGSDVSLGRRVVSVPTLVGFLMAGAFLSFLIMRLDIDLADIGRNLSQSNPLLYGTALIIYYLSFLFRGLRWRMMLGSVEIQRGSGLRPPGVLASAQYILLAWFSNAITWFRLGEAYRAYLVSESTGASFSRTVGTVLAERVLDLVLVFALLSGAVLFAAATGELGAFGTFVGAAFALVLAAILVLLLMRRFGLRIAQWLPGPVAQAYIRFHQGALLGFRNLPVIALLGLAAWLCEVARLLFVVQALGFDLPFSMVVFVSLAYSLLTTIPITPGGLGIAEPGMVGLLMLRMSQSHAISVALLDRTITYLSIVVLGGVVFLAREARRQWKGVTPLARSRPR